MEPWDGPALDRVHRRHADRRGARPQRPAPRPVLGDRRRPGRAGLRGRACSTSTRPTSSARAGCSPAGCSWSTPRRGAIVEDDEIKAELAAEHPYERLAARRAAPPRRPARPGSAAIPTHEALVKRRQQTFGYTEEELRIILAPMAQAGAEPIGSMGTDTPVAVLSERPRLLFDYFTQLFAQVTNPPLDAIREELVTSLASDHRARGQPARPRARRRCRQIVLPYPVIDNDELAKIIHINDERRPARLRSRTWSPASTRSAGGGAALRARLEEICAEVVARRSPTARASSCCPTAASTADLAPIPSLLLTGAVHHHLIREKTRTRVGLVVETGDAREVPPHRAADRLRRGRGQPVPGDRDRRGPGRRRGAQASTPRARPYATCIKALRQGRAEGHVQDGRLHRRLLHRRADLRGASASARRSSTPASPAPPRGSAASASTCSPRRSPRGTPTPTRAAPSTRTAGWRSAASTSGGARASRTCSTPRRSSSCSTPPAPAATRSSRSTPAWSTTSRERLMTLRGLFKLQGRRARPPVPIDEVEPVARDRQAVRHRRHVLRLDLGGGARDPRHRHEPARRQVATPARAARTPTASSRRQRRLRRSRDQAGGVAAGSA